MTDWAPVVAQLRGFPVPVPAEPGTMFTAGIFMAVEAASIMECPHRGCEKALATPAWSGRDLEDWDAVLLKHMRIHMRSHTPVWRRVLRDVWEGLVAVWRLAWWR